MKRFLKLAVVISFLFSMGCAPAVVGGGAAGGYKVATDERSAGTQWDDAAITTKIKAGLFDDLALKARKIDVDTVDGVVTLTGIVGSQEEVNSALRIARNTKHVKHVVNNLEVGSMTVGEAIDDSVIGGKIKGKLIKEPGVRSLSIDVDVTKGVVTLTGMAGSVEIKNRILQLARETKGVIRVIDNISVSYE